MATRFRLPANTTAAVSPSVQSYTHTGSTRRELATSDASALATQAITPDGADHLVAGDTLHIQFVSAPLVGGIAFVTSDTVKYAIQGLEANAANNLFVQLFVRVVSEDGTVARATIRSKVADATELGTALASRTASHALSAGYTTVQGDRLVVEFSVVGTPTAAGGVQGHNASLRFGSDGVGGDLLENDTQTGTTLNPWIEFSRTTPEYVPESASGGSTASVTVADVGAGSMGAQGGSVASVTVDAEGGAVALPFVVGPVLYGGRS